MPCGHHLPQRKECKPIRCGTYTFETTSLGGDAKIDCHGVGDGDAHGNGGGYGESMANIMALVMAMAMMMVMAVVINTRQRSHHSSIMLIMI